MTKKFRGFFVSRQVIYVKQYPWIGSFEIHQLKVVANGFSQSKPSQWRTISRWLQERNCIQISDIHWASRPTAPKLHSNGIRGSNSLCGVNSITNKKSYHWHAKTLTSVQWTYEKESPAQSHLIFLNKTHRTIRFLFPFWTFYAISNINCELLHRTLITWKLNADRNLIRRPIFKCHFIKSLLFATSIVVGFPSFSSYFLLYFREYSFLFCSFHLFRSPIYLVTD